MSGITDEEIDGMMDWYDQALANGQGFQSEEERQAYFDELGDPLMHPFWAESTEDLEGNPMVEAFRCLREEDKTKVELALMYKDEGNEWIKKKTKKDLNEAIARYNHAFTFLDEADLNRKNDTEEEGDKGVNLHQVRSQILNNRALASMQLKNYGSALRDINKVECTGSYKEYSYKYVSYAMCVSGASPVARVCEGPLPKSKGRQSTAFLTPMITAVKLNSVYSKCAVLSLR